jgi:hypothetical protein
MELSAAASSRSLPPSLPTEITYYFLLKTCGYVIYSSIYLRKSPRVSSFGEAFGIVKMIVEHTEF